MSVLEHLEPKNVFHFFEELSRIPRGSGNTRQVSDYLVDFAKERGLDYYQDELDNVVIYKPAAPGYEEAPGIILQGHMDMVCEKKPESNHDFIKDPLELQVEGDLISAKDTTLGGDNGIAVAYGLAILDSREYEHPSLELLITSDEEIGLLGATGFDCSHLKGKRLINLDSEDDAGIWISCAGGLSGSSHIPVKYVEACGLVCNIQIKGLLGGHSGAEIDKIRANANLLMGRLLYEMKEVTDYELAAIEGGLKDNAIPRECRAVVLIPSVDREAAETFAAGLEGKLREEYAGTDEGIEISAEFGEEVAMDVLHPTSREKTIFYLMQIPYGIQKMSGSIENLVETSTNLGILKLGKQELTGSSGVRSSVEAARDYISDKIAYLTEFLGGEYEIQGAYPAWEYRRESPLRDKAVEVYRRVFEREPQVVAIHAGLECGLFYKNIPGLDCISIGPTMKDIHTSEETLSISSVKRVWEYVLELLKELK